jgi:hypothetical protein
MVFWSEFLATDPGVRVRFPELSDYLRSSESGNGFTQSREYTEELLGRNNISSSLETENTAVGIRSADHATPLYPQTLALTSRQAAVAR